MIGYNFDLATIALYLFWAFFAGLIYYLHRENKREGYPLVTDRKNEPMPVLGFPAPPPPKTYLLADGKKVVVDGRADNRPVKAEYVGPFPGAPLEPTGNPMVDGVGPAAYAEREDHPDMTLDGHPKIVPLRAAPDYYLESRDPDPRGMNVKGADGKVAGAVKDVWVDKSEYIVRYYEVAVAGSDKTVLVPSTMCRVDGGRRELRVKAVLASQFADAPALRKPDVVTLLEEDKICGYFGGGYLYAEPSRLEPLL
jgi:photosynthetic reaction center H subunit